MFDDFDLRGRRSTKSKSRREPMRRLLATGGAAYVKPEFDLEYGPSKALVRCLTRHSIMFARDGDHALLRDSRPRRDACGGVVTFSYYPDYLGRYARVDLPVTAEELLHEAMLSLPGRTPLKCPWPVPDYKQGLIHDLIDEDLGSPVPELDIDWEFGDEFGESIGGYELIWNVVDGKRHVQEFDGRLES